MNAVITLPLRKSIERRIEYLIALLDALDGDCDLEDGADDEPSIGSQLLFSPFGMEIDLEEDDERQEDPGDYDYPGFIHGGQGL